MKRLVLGGFVCFALGFAVGRIPEARFHDEEMLPFSVKLSSEGRVEMKNMINAFNKELRPDLADIMADKTRTLQAITADHPDRAEAEFYADKMAEKIYNGQLKTDKILFDALEKMPVADRHTYMRHYLKNRDVLKKRMIMVPLLVEADLMEQEMPTRPRDMIVRKKQK